MRMHGHGAHDDMSYVPAGDARASGASATRSSATRERLVAEHGFAERRGRARSAPRSSADVDECAEQGARLADARPGDRRRGRLRRALGAARRRRGAVVALERAETRRARSRLSAATPATHGRRRAREMTYLEAISDALREEMRRDESVFCLGEDIGAFGGAFKVTDGFVEEFGADRVLDTPLAENAIIGAAVGAAIEGLRPVCEMQFADFIACGFDQLVNVAAKLHYRQGIAVPMVVRLPSGGGFSGGPFHSQNPEAWFLQAPGLKVVAPATAADAKGLLASAIRDPNPVCFLEHKGLYRHVRGEVPDGRAPVPHRRGARRPRGRGDDGDRLRLRASASPLQAAEELGEDDRGDRPAHALPARHRGDRSPASRKTGKVLVAHEATRSCGVGAEVAALIAERGVRATSTRRSGG